MSKKDILSKLLKEFYFQIRRIKKILKLNDEMICGEEITALLKYYIQAPIKSTI